MNIAYIVSMGNGLEPFIYREVDELYKKGLKIKLFTTKFKANDIFSPKPEWEYYTFSIFLIVFWFPFLLLASPVRNAKLLVEAVQHSVLPEFMIALYYAAIMKRIGIEKVHCHFGDRKLFVGYFCKKILDMPLTVTIHAHEFYTNPNPMFFKKALHSCDIIFPIAEKWAQLLIDQYGVPSNRIRLNRLFVDTDFYRPSTNLRILTVGRFTERKGFHILLEAMKQLGDSNIVLIIVGFGPVDIRAMVSRMELQDRVVVFDKMSIDQLRQLYQSVHIYCLPSITTEKEGAEGIPVVLMEAMACGLPVIATRCGAIEELVEEILVDEKNPEQIAAAIRTLEQQPEMRRIQGLRNRNRVMEYYSSKNLDLFVENLVGQQAEYDI